MDCANKKIIGCALILPAVFAATTVSAGVGTDVAWLMNYYYNRTLDDCGAGRPLDQCSGLRVRGTNSRQVYEPWDPSPYSVTSGGVSMSFLRKDAKYEDLGLKKANGFVLKPNDFIGVNEEEVSTLCMFPIDAWTDDRRDEGCTDNTTTDPIEKACQHAGINTAEQWLTHYRSVNSAHEKQCGFEIRNRSDASSAFWQGIRARKLIQNDSDAIHTQTEIRVPPWGQEKDAQLPILAFIYTPNPGLPSGLEDARDDLNRYFQKTGKWVPVIKVTLPTSNSADAHFTYNEGDQHREAPTPIVDNECARYIEGATWVRREDPYIQGEPWSLLVRPTECGRKMTKEQQSAAYAELFVKYGSDPQWQPDNGSMQRQFVCLLEWSGEVNGEMSYTRNKATWNMEPVRPVVSRGEIFKQGCNPY